MAEIQVLQLNVADAPALDLPAEMHQCFQSRRDDLRVLRPLSSQRQVVQRAARPVEIPLAALGEVLEDVLDVVPR